MLIVAPIDLANLMVRAKSGASVDIYSSVILSVEPYRCLTISKACSLAPLSKPKTSRCDCNSSASAKESSVDTFVGSCSLAILKLKHKIKKYQRLEGQGLRSRLTRSKLLREPPWRPNPRFLSGKAAKSRNRDRRDTPRKYPTQGEASSWRAWRDSSYSAPAQTFFLKKKRARRPSKENSNVRRDILARWVRVHQPCH
jgi:hypothetical protein